MPEFEGRRIKERERQHLCITYIGTGVSGWWRAMEVTLRP